MTVDLVHPDAEPARPPVHMQHPTVGAAVSLIQQTALDLDAAYKIANAICGTALAPRDFRGKPADGAAAIMLGATLGLDPMISLQNIFIVHGAPSMYARTMAAVAQAQGHEIWTESEGDGTVTVCGKRRDSDHIERVTFTIRDAERAGYTKQNAKYSTDPKSMLYARALSICSRRLAPDALLGVPYSIEELEDLSDVEKTTVTRSSVSRLRSAVPVSEQPAIEAAPPEAESPTLNITAAQRKRLGNLFDKHGMGNRDDALAYTASAIGRQVESSADLTRDEAVTVILALETLDDPATPTAADVAAMNDEADAEIVEDVPSGLFGDA